MKKRILSLLLTPALLLGMLPAFSLSLSATKPEELQQDNETLTVSYLNASTDRHPSILFTEDELPALREKTEDGMSKSAYDAMRNLANNYKNLSASPYTFVSGGIAGRVLQLHLTTLTFYGRMLGEKDGKAYVDKAKAILLSAVAQGDLEACYKVNGQLAIGDFATAFALGYDWLYHDMTEEERKQVKDRMMELGEWIYTASTTGTEPLVGGKTDKAHWAEESPTRSAWNWNTVIHTGLTLISMVTGEHPEWMARGLDRIEAYYTYAKNEDGMPQEGLSYTGYGMRIAVVIDASLVKHTGVSLIDRHEDLKNYMTYYTWAQLPDTGTGAIDTNQSNGLGNISIPYYLANRYKSEEALWAVMAGNNLLDGGVGTLTSTWAGDGFDLPQLIVFEDKALKPKEPTVSGMMNFGGQEVIFRSGFSHKNSVAHSLASLRIGTKYPSIWHHPDSGNITFHAFNQSFLIDLGAGKRDVAQHNGMIYGAEGPKTTTEAVLTAAREIAEGAYMATVDLTDTYNVAIKTKSVSRTVIYTNGNCPYVLVYDNGVIGSAGTATANWYTKATNKITETENGLRITGTGDAVCDVYLFDETGKGSLAVGTGGAFTSNLPKGRDFGVISLFAASSLADQAPKIAGSCDENGVLTVTVTYKDAEGREQTDIITASDDGVIYQSTARETIEETTTESIPATTEEPSAVTTEITTDATTEASEIPSKDSTETESEGESKTEKTPQGGCASVLGAGTAMIAGTVGAGGILALRRKKKED